MSVKKQHKDNDLYTLLTSSESRPEGAYNHATWEIKTRGEVDSDAVLITSVHEAMHDQLNNSTAYGLVLIVLAHLAREGAIDKNKLLFMVNAYRNAHEIFATYTSLLMVSQKDILLDLIEQDYPDYSKYVKQAQFLLLGSQKNHIQYPIINSLIRVCFQNPALFDYLEDETLLEIKPIDCPDRRLIMLSKYLNKERLQGWLVTFVETHERPNEARRFINAENDLGMIIAEEEYFDAMGQSLSDFVYETIREDERVGFSVMGFDDHLSFIDDLLIYANKLAPMVTATMPLVASTDYDKINAVSQYEAEAVTFNEQLLSASIIPFDEYPIKDWNTLLMKAEGDAYLYIISRITERFVTQYQFSDDDQAWLFKEYPDFVISIVVKQALENSYSLLFVVLDDPQQIKALDKKKFPMMANSSLFLTSDILWEPWYDSFAQYCSHTILFDLSPSVQLERSLSIFDRINYNSFHLETEEGEYVFIILIAKGENMMTGVFFIPCSAVMSNLLLSQFQKDKKQYTLLDPENDLSRDLEWLLRVQMTRLVDESRFDFKAVSSQYAIRGFKDDRFHSTK